MCMPMSWSCTPAQPRPLGDQVAQLAKPEDKEFFDALIDSYFDEMEAEGG